MRLVTDTIEFARARRAAVEHDLDLRLPHPRGGLRRRRRSWPSRWPTASTTSRRRWSAAWTWTTSRRGCRSSSTATSTSSRRSPSSAPPGASGPGACATRTARRTRAPGCCASTRRPRAARSRRSSREQHRAHACQALAAVLGGTQCLHTNCMDETLALPTEKAVTIALRTQQIIAYETRRRQHGRPARRAATSSRTLTNQMERGAPTSLRAHRRAGRRGAGAREGLLPARDRQGRLHYQREVETRRGGHRGRQQVRGARRTATSSRCSRSPTEIERECSRRPGRAAPHAQRRQGARGARPHARRTPARRSNLMPAFMQAREAYATLGEMVDVLREVFGD